MSYVKDLLARKEYVARVTRDHWLALLTTILVDGALCIVVIGLSVAGVTFFSGWTMFGLLLLAVPVVHFLVRFWVWWNKQYVVTNRRILQISGTVNKRVSDTSLEKVNDIVMEQSMMGRLLKYGDLEIIAGSDSGVDVFRRISDPVGFKKELLDQKAALGGLDVFDEPLPAKPEPSPAAADEVPEMIAELDDLRQKGLLSDDEFEEKRQQLLNRI